MLNAVFIALIVGIIIIFSVQNAASLSLSFLIWDIEVSFMVIAVTFVFAGILLAQLLRGLTTKRQWHADRRNR